MEKIYFLCGIQGSGKSTFAKNHYQQYNADVISTDQIRKEAADVRSRNKRQKRNCSD